MDPTTLVPRPRRVERRDGHVALAADAVVRPDGGEEARRAADLLVELLELESGGDLSPSVSTDAADADADVTLRTVDAVAGAGGSEEAYRLAAADGTVAVDAPTAAGLGYGAQTLVGVLETRDGGWRVPACELRDWPRSE